jgi:hypothetical protein
MPKKAKKRVFRASTAVKSAARNVIGSPPPTKREIPKNKKSQEKHRPTLGKFLSQNE